MKPPKEEAVSWWVGKGRAEFYAEAARREIEVQSAHGKRQMALPRIGERLPADVAKREAQKRKERV